MKIDIRYRNLKGSELIALNSAAEHILVHNETINTGNKEPDRTEFEPEIETGAHTVTRSKKLTPLKLTIQDVTAEGLLKACYMGSALGYKFYEEVKEQRLFNALREDVAENFPGAAPKKGLARLLFKIKPPLKQERNTADARLRGVITDIRDEYLRITKSGKPAASMFGTKARLRIVLKILGKMAPNPFPKTTGLLNELAFNKDEECFFLAQAHLFGYLQVAHIFGAMSACDISNWHFSPRARSDPR